MHSKKHFLLLILLVALFPTVGIAQNLNQTIRGNIIDVDSKSEIIGATILLLNYEPLTGTSTDINGNFRLEKIPIGRHNLLIQSIGYEDKVIPNILLTSTKEIVLHIELDEAFEQLEEIEIVHRKNAEVINEMALSSARSFSVEETKRYAGSLNDPARMVSAFAGVTSDAEGNNSIVVRGNSSKGILWRLEGIEIPNPNHFSDEGSTGGPINALNSSMLSNSDFYTGAFAPEYGNVSSGVFDMKLRSGNNEQHEKSFSIGILGLETTLEGPLKKGSQASYLFNYRYSSLALLDGLNIVDFDGVPKYQDASFKLHLPSSIGVFTLFGLGGKSATEEDYFDEKLPELILEKEKYDAQLGVIGLTHIVPFTKKTYLKSALSVSQNGSGFNSSFLNNQSIFQESDNTYLDKSSYRVQSSLHYKKNVHHKFQVGFFATQYRYNFLSEELFSDSGKLETLIKDKGNANLLQSYVSWKYRITDRLSTVVGLHHMYFHLNRKQTIESRFSLNWNFKENQNFSFGYGKHSKTESLTSYLSIVQSNGIQSRPNKNLDFSKAQHFVVGYSNSISPQLLLKIETYYQHLKDVPVYNSMDAPISLLNSDGWFDNIAFINKGFGTNYGIEFTLEKFLTKGYYFLTTASFYESKFKALDGIQRDTRYNGNFAGNLLFGKEFIYGSKKDKTFGTSIKALYLGATPYTPVDLEASILAGHSVRNSQLAYTAKEDAIFQLNLALYYRKEKKKVSHEIKLDIQNVSNNQAKLRAYYNSETTALEYDYQLSLIPSIYYKIQF